MTRVLCRSRDRKFRLLNARLFESEPSEVLLGTEEDGCQFQTASSTTSREDHASTRNAIVLRAAYIWPLYLHHACPLLVISNLSRQSLPIPTLRGLTLHLGAQTLHLVLISTLSSPQNSRLSECNEVRPKPTVGVYLGAQNRTEGRVRSRDNIPVGI